MLHFNGDVHVAANLPEKSAAHAQRAGAPKGDFVLSHAISKIMGEDVKKMINPLQNEKKPVYSAPYKTPAPVAQLDRASVFGTEG